MCSRGVARPTVGLSARVAARRRRFVRRARSSPLRPLAAVPEPVECRQSPVARRRTDEGSRRTSSRAWSSCIKAGSSLRSTSNACLAIRRSRGVISVSWRRHEYRRAAPAHGRRPCALYFLLAAGHSLIWGLMRVLNFAHGAFSRPPLMPDCSRRRSSRAVRP